MSNVKEELYVPSDNNLKDQEKQQTVNHEVKEENTTKNGISTININDLQEEITKNELLETTSFIEPRNITQTYCNNPMLERIVDVPTCSGENITRENLKALVPICSSLPTKLLLSHAKKSADLLQEHMVQLQNQSIDFPVSTNYSTEGTKNTDHDDIHLENFDVSTLNTVPISSIPSMVGSSAQSTDEKVDVGMGSSIDGSEESEVDDELKPLAIDNHALDSRPTTSKCEMNLLSSKALELSEANIEKFQKHHHHSKMNNIYLHPNIKREYLEKSPPPAVAPANSPIERNQQEQHLLLQESVHRSLLSCNTTCDNVHETDNSVISQSTTASDKAIIKEIDALDSSLIPDDDLAAKIAEAVEFYFSNDSILKDAFLLKHVRRNKEGYVSLKLVSSFKYVRQLTKDWRVAGYAIRLKSKKIELNNLGTKVRRLEPLPNFDETMPSRTIVACDLPLDKLTIEKVSDIFSKCGEIALIRILKPGMTLPVDVRQFMNKHPEMQQKECALVEYLESCAAREARTLQGPFKVYEMVAPKKKTGKKSTIQTSAPIVRMVENYRHYNDQNYERTRGGSFSGVISHDPDLRFKLRRNNSEVHNRVYGDVSLNLQSHPPFSSADYENVSRSNNYTHQNYHHSNGSGLNQENQAQPSLNINNNYLSYGPRHYRNVATIQNNVDVATSNMPYMGSNRDNNANSIIRRGSNAVQEIPFSFDYNDRSSSNCMVDSNSFQKRDLNYEGNYINTRRISGSSQPDFYRKNSQGSVVSVGDRRLSNDFMPFERFYSSATDYQRRKSNDYQHERRSSLETHMGTAFDDSNVGGGGGGYNVFPRRHSNTFSNVNSKLSAYDNAQYIGGRRISTDSGYDRRYSFGSEYGGSPRSRTGSFLNNYKQHIVDYDSQPRSRTGSFLDGSPRSRSGSFAQRAAENLVRTPFGPDGSKGFECRIRKITEAVPSFT